MKRHKSPAQLEQEIEAALETARVGRYRRDQIERPTPQRVLGRIDHFLSSAEDQIGKHLTTSEVKESSPDVYKLGNELHDEIERLRWKLRKWRP